MEQARRKEVHSLGLLWGPHQGREWEEDTLRAQSLTTCEVV